MRIRFLQASDYAEPDPKLWMQFKYFAKFCVQVVKEYQIPEFDNLYLDMNGKAITVYYVNNVIISITYIILL